MSTRGVSSPNEPRWLRLVCFSFVVMRCQPLRRALCDSLYRRCGGKNKSVLAQIHLCVEH
ncbi:hypothetical protein I7101_003954 [Vibrio cholerae]|nr:hypothetical protein [Vibrio cholerae]